MKSQQVWHEIRLIIKRIDFCFSDRVIARLILISFYVDFRFAIRVHISPAFVLFMNIFNAKVNVSPVVFSSKLIYG